MLLVVRKNLKRVVLFLADLLSTAGRLFYKSEQEKRVVPWFRDNGDKTLRLNYDLNDKSVVFDLGGYEGQWASDIFSKYCCIVHVFEPVDEFYEKINLRFESNSKIFVHKFGLSGKNENVSICLDNDASSMFKGEGKLTDIRIVKALDFINENNIRSIDLMKINIEGGEYDLLDHLLSSGFIENIKNLQIQFHDFVPNAQERVEGIQEKLSETHFLVYQYPFVWENWQIKE